MANLVQQGRAVRESDTLTEIHDLRPEFLLEAHRRVLTEYLCLLEIYDIFLWVKIIRNLRGEAT